MERLRNYLYMSVGISDKKGSQARILTEEVTRKGALRKKKKFVMVSFRSK
jgi:hypothetical protein